MLKSDTPRFCLMLNHGGLEMEFKYSSPTMLLEEESMLFPQV